MSERLFFSGNNLQQALLAAARHFRLDPEEVAFHERERRGGFIKNPRVVIEVDPAAPRRLPPPAAAPPPRPAPVTPRPEAPRAASAEPADLTRDAAQAVRQLLGLAGINAEATAELDLASRELRLELAGPDAARLVDDQGALLEILEHLVPRLLRGALGEAIFCRADSQGFRAAREERLRRLAQEAAEIVRRDGRPHALPEMTPAERRIVHLALEGDPSVTTESHGEGYLKSVTVSPA